MGYTDFYIFLIPLYGLSLGMSAGEIGMLVGARSLLAVFLSIHVGALMDRFGTRRVTLFFVWTAMALAPVFPLVPWFWPLLLLQIVNGGALSFAWSGSQTLIAQLAEGEAEYIGRFSFFARIGTTAAPMIAGARLGFRRRLAVLYGRRAWGVVLTVALLRAPEADDRAGEGRRRARPRGSALRDVLPAPAGLCALLCADGDPGGGDDDGDHFLRTATNGVQCLALCRLSQRDRADRHDDRHPVRGDRGGQRPRLAVRRTGDAARRPAEDDAERHRAVDPA